VSRAKPKPAPPDLHYNVLCAGGCGDKLHRMQSHIMYRSDVGWGTPTSNGWGTSKPPKTPETSNTSHVSEPEILGGVCDACMLIVNLFTSAGVFVADPWLTAAGKLAEFEPQRRREAEAAARLGARGDEVLAVLRGGR